MGLEVTMTTFVGKGDSQRLSSFMTSDELDSLTSNEEWSTYEGVNTQDMV